ncbi:hypothetical protein [Hymenobacter jeollabukensis]|uniref:Phosphatase PAP2 family protein n=1 Tax=Hymenobacter jeollabukensis TaxID=2025313 RepID=A0A5R8WV49_9BACT|nr:hypothetical protein [Hymenobacter jeollabukensis]TLM95274.1 hypothetical protein FDY95_05665 [Hymenobacter jeollabukensis]
MKDRLAYGLSVVLHPMLVPTYLVLLLCYGWPGRLPVSGVAPVPAALLLQAWALSFWLPSLLIGLMARFGLISSVELPDRRQRTAPLLLAAGGFAAAAVLLASYAPQASLLSRLFAGITVSVLLTTLITLWWKISAHGVGMGGASGLSLWLLTAPGSGSAAPLTLLAVVLLAAAVGWARLRLRAHTRAQVLAGLGLGTVIGLTFSAL